MTCALDGATATPLDLTVGVPGMELLAGLHISDIEQLGDTQLGVLGVARDEFVVIAAAETSDTDDTYATQDLLAQILRLSFERLG